MPVKPIPDGYNTITAYLAVTNAAKALEFYKAALGATEIFRLPGPNGTIGHLEMQIGNSRIMMADPMPGMDVKTAKALGATPITLCIYTENVDALAERFQKAGGKVLRPLTNQFYGDRSGMFEDPEGYQWNLMQHVEDVSPQEMMKRMQQMGG